MMQETGMKSGLPAYLVVEGPIGVGKTSLARRLAETFRMELLLEGADDNPFLERFYQNPRDAALSTQMYFLLQRAEQLRVLRQEDFFMPTRVADFLFEKDRLFAGLTLNEDELTLYEKVYEQLAPDVRAPDLLIYLQAPVEVLMDRIRRRAVAHEQNISADYLRRLCEAYVNFFYHYERSPLLIVNAAEIDLINNDADYHLLLECISSVRTGRHYFNPAPISL